MSEPGLQGIALGIVVNMKEALAKDKLLRNEKFLKNAINFESYKVEKKKLFVYDVKYSNAKVNQVY